MGRAVGTLDAPRNVYHRDFLPCLGAAGLRRVTLHALQHTFAPLLIQRGASLACAKDEMGHSSIQVTVDTYGHPIPGENVEWIDRLDAGTNRQAKASQAPPAMEARLGKFQGA